MHFQFQPKVGVELAGFASIYQDKWAKQQEDNSFNDQEPTSVLHMRSQSPPTSASTLSSSFNGGSGGGGSGGNFTTTTIVPPESTQLEFQPIQSELDLVTTGPVGVQRCNNLGIEDWEAMLFESTVSPSQDQNSLLRWIAGDVDDHGLKQLLQTGPDFIPGFDPMDPGNLGYFPQNPIFTSPPESIGLYQQLENQEMKPQILNPPNPNFFLPFPQEQQPLPKRLSHGQIPKLPFSDHELFIKKQQLVGFQEQKPLMVSQQQQAATLLDQLCKVAEMVETGNFSHAQGILARLNHLSPVGKTFQRIGFYFKEALQLLLLMYNNTPVSKNPTPFDVIFKMGAYKVFSEVSPFVQFVNFTSNQAFLEALENSDRIHIVDFDIGFGAQWASFMQELPMRSKGVVPSLRITAFVSLSTYHPIELGLIRENLEQFANGIGVNFELEVLNFDCLDQNPYSLPMFRMNENEALAVNFPVWSASYRPSILPNLLRIVKQLRPKIVVSLDRGCDRNDLSFPQHIINAFYSYISLLESLDAAVNVTSDAINKIERFLIVPKIETTVLGRLHSLEKMPPWKTLFASAGFTPLTFSNFTETQAECVVKRAQVRGFHIEKCHASLVLCWQQKELISASAWRC
ncbi:hypothetical protein ES288_D03G200600v1 [Gossypium darwinii]|uniref:Uncharacterized protein n=1 Tax=Gossypium darwinii TaxID=34276 RepID=A0A5D2D6P2_GOSDA|nr:hypothetical protein ES288_D03G200600v1 [Gossypium darwinii]